MVNDNVLRRCALVRRTGIRLPSTSTTLPVINCVAIEERSAVSSMALFFTEVRSSIRRSTQGRASILYLTPDQHCKLNRIVNRSFELWAQLNWFAPQPDCGNQAGGNEQGTTLFVVIRHVKYDRRRKSELSSMILRLAFAGGRTSEPAAVRGDRAATATYGIAS